MYSPFRTRRLWKSADRIAFVQQQAGLKIEGLEQNTKAIREAGQRGLPVTGMRITHLNASDLVGGHARAAYRLHTGLRRLGHQSRLLVLQKDVQTDDVTRFEPPADIRTRFRRVFLRHFLAHQRRILARRPAGSAHMTDGRSEHGADALRQALPCDVLHLHWVSGLIDYREFFRQLPQDMRVVWTFHDMSPFTGGCDHADGCEKYRQRCGACPQLDSREEEDLSRRVWDRQKTAVASMNPRFIRLVAPSRWMAAEARASALVGGLPISVIPYGLDTDRFQPRDRTFARQLFGIPPDAKVLLFLAERASQKRKGLHLLFEAISGLSGLQGLYCFVVGEGASINGFGISGQTAGLLRDDLTLSLAYSAADVFVIPSLVENFPNTGLEAIACGTPVVGFSVGGIPEIVREGQTGTLVPRGDTRALREAIAGLLQNPERRALLGAQCRQVAVQEYSLEVQAKRYVALYESIGKEHESADGGELHTALGSD